VETSKEIQWRDPVQVYQLRKARQFWVVAGILALALVVAFYWLVYR
jgi:hypothetical protein